MNSIQKYQLVNEALSSAEKDVLDTADIRRVGDFFLSIGLSSSVSLLLSSLTSGKFGLTGALIAFAVTYGTYQAVVILRAVLRMKKRSKSEINKAIKEFEIKVEAAKKDPKKVEMYKNRVSQAKKKI